ncbi:MAG: hypothetical protein IT200_15125 [Thermoleophilia bacterium]|nr:hypothetical protein [Thermoleophilia bacterium]
MIEAVVILTVAAGAVVRTKVVRRTELRRARERAERVLDELAADTCSALAKGRETRRSARAVRRYAETRDLVAGATTRRELDRLVARHHRRRAAAHLAARGMGRARGIVTGGIPRRRTRGRPGSER